MFLCPVSIVRPVPKASPAPSVVQVHEVIKAPRANLGCLEEMASRECRENLDRLVGLLSFPNLLIVICVFSLSGPPGNIGPSGIPGEKGRDVEQPIGRVRHKFVWQFIVVDSRVRKDLVDRQDPKDRRETQA